MSVADSLFPTVQTCWTPVPVPKNLSLTILKKGKEKGEIKSNFFNSPQISPFVANL